MIFGGGNVSTLLAVEAATTAVVAAAVAAAVAATPATAAAGGTTAAGGGATGTGAGGGTGTEEVTAVPGGIGVYDAMMVAVMVAAGIPANLSLSVTIMYRVLNTIIQLPPGYYFWHKRIDFRENLSAENDG